MNVSIRNGIVFLFSILWMIGNVAEAEPLRFIVSSGSPTVIKFESKASLESFAGGTDQLVGWFSFDTDNFGSSIDGELVADMTSFRTGIPVRDNHMRENHLEVGTYPISVFKPKGLKPGAPPRITGGESVSFTLLGDFTIHGVTKQVEAEVQATLQPDRRSIDVWAAINIPLADFSIPRPEFLFMRVGEVQKVQTKFIATKN
ncbi:YceI family protein [bacterium]|nr:YceI family protein [bacterium]